MTSEEKLIEYIKSKQFQSSNNFQRGYQLALNDILYEVKKLYTGNIKASKYVNVGNFKKEKGL